MYGKILGSLVGLMWGLTLSSPWLAFSLAVAGGLVGHAFDLGLETRFAARLRPTAALPSAGPFAPETLIRHICALLMEVARADGEVRRAEVRAMREFFSSTLRYGPAEMEQVRLTLKATLSGAEDVEAAARACRVALEAPDRHRLALALFAVGLADGPLTSSERHALQEALDGLGLSPAEQQRLRAESLPEEEALYETFGISNAATNDELKSAFRRLAAEVHPDKVAHLGRDEVARAEERFRYLKERYDTLRRLRDI